MHYNCRYMARLAIDLRVAARVTQKLHVPLYVPPADLHATTHLLVRTSHSPSRATHSLARTTHALPRTHARHTAFYLCPFITKSKMPKHTDGNGFLEVTRHAYLCVDTGYAHIAQTHTQLTALPSSVRPHLRAKSCACSPPLAQTCSTRAGTWGSR